MKEMGRSPCCAKEGVNRGAWTAMEDKKLTDYILLHGQGKWKSLPKKAGLQRCGKSCRLRWLNYLRPDIKRGNITNDEEELIIRLHKLLGNRWSLIAGRLPGRTDNEIKNYWNTIIGKKLQQQQRRFCPNPTIKNNNSMSPNDHHGSKLFHSKPSKCTKVVDIPLTDEPHNDHVAALAPPLAPTSNEEASLMDFGLKDDDDNSNNNNSGDDILLDFEMDEQLLLDLLHSDYSELNNNIDHGAPSETNTCSKNKSFLDSNEDYSGFPYVDNSLLEPEFDWF